jgi:hypothetical protein
LAVLVPALLVPAVLVPLVPGMPASPGAPPGPIPAPLVDDAGVSESLLQFAANAAPMRIRAVVMTFFDKAGPPPKG